MNELEQRIDALQAELNELRAKCGQQNVKKIDWSKMPVDTLCEVRDSDTEDWVKRYFSHTRNGVTFVYINGTNSKTVTYANAFEQLRLIENEPKPWFGGECPLPEGVKVKAWLFNGKELICEGANLEWHFHGIPAGTAIRAYQILGPMEGWE